MSDNTAKRAGGAAPPEEIPFMQRLLDNPFLLLALGIAVPTMLYTVWGVIEVVLVPLAQ